MKIDLVTETFPPEVNGVAMTLKRLVGGLAKRGHDMTVIRPRQPADGAPRNLPFREVRLRGMGVPGYRGIRVGFPATRYLRRHWRAAPPDLVHVATEGPLGWSAAREARRLGLPLITSFHTNFHTYARHYSVPWLTTPVMSWLRTFHARGRMTLAPTVEMIAHLEECGFSRLRLMGRGVDTALFSPARRDPALRTSWGAGKDDVVLLSVGRVAPEKNLGLFMRSVEALRQRHPEVKTVVVGDGPILKKLRVRYPFVNYTGFRHDEDLAAHYASADMFLFPSLSETFGNVVTEALASGLVTVAFDCAAAALHIRDGENGCLVSPGDADGFVERVVAAMGQQERWAAIRQAARETALGIPWDFILDQYERDTRDALAGVEFAPAP